MSAEPGDRASAGLRIGARRIARGAPCYVIAEAGVNHGGSLPEALRLVHAAREAGADAVKFQIFRAASLARAAAPAAAYQRAGGASQREMLAALELTASDFRTLAAECAAVGIEFLATPFGLAEVDALASLGVRAIKISSADLNNLPLLRRAAQLRVPLIASTGAAEREEILAAIQRLRALVGADGFALLHCVSCYPTPAQSANIRAVATLADLCGGVAGYSDHTSSLDSGALAVAAGACIVEKHITMDRAARGPDHAASLDPGGFAEYVRRLRSAEVYLGSGALGMSEVEADVRRVARRSLVAARELSAGARLSAEDIVAKRPAGGIEPDRIDELVGRRLRVALACDTPFSWDLVE